MNQNIVFACLLALDPAGGVYLWHHPHHPPPHQQQSKIQKPNPCYLPKMWS